MASNRIRAIRNVGTRLNNLIYGVGQTQRRPVPRKLAQNLIDTGNMRRYMAEQPIIAPNAITNEKFTDGSVTEDEIADDAVTEDKLDMDAMTGKNITSCNITDSDINNCRFSDLTGSTLTVTDTFALTNGVIKQVDITGPSTVTGEDVVFSEVKMLGVTADVITADGTLLFDAGGDAVINSGATAQISAGGGSLSISGGTFNYNGYFILGSAASFSSSWDSFTFSGVKYMRFTEWNERYLEVVEAISDAEAAIPACGCL